MPYDIQSANPLAALPIEAAEPAPEAAMPPAAPAAAPQRPPDASKVADAGALLESNPVVKVVYNGVLPAVSALDSVTDPVIADVSNNIQALMAVGLDFYVSQDKKTGVIFNPQLITGEELQQADAIGQLETVAPPYNQVVKTFGKSAKPIARPVTKPITPLPKLVPMPGPARVGGTMAAMRSKNLAPGSPSTGMRPGGGRLLNQAAERAV